MSKTLQTWGNGKGKREERRYLQTAGGTEEFPVANHSKVNSGHHDCLYRPFILRVLAVSDSTVLFYVSNLQICSVKAWPTEVPSHIHSKKFQYTLGSDSQRLIFVRLWVSCTSREASRVYRKIWDQFEDSKRSGERGNVPK